MAADAAELERRVMAAVKASAVRGDPPLLQAAEAAAASSAACGLALAEALVANLCFAHNTGAMWKLLDQAMSSRLVHPLHTLALLTPRVVPNRREQPEAYRLYLELLGRYLVAPVYPERKERKSIFSKHIFRKDAAYGLLAKSIDDAMQLAHRYGFQHLDFGHAVILFVLSVVEMLIDCILDDCGSLNTSAHGHDNIYIQNTDFDGKGIPLDRGDAHREHLRRNNILMSIEVIEKATANKIAQVFLRLVYLNITLQDTSSVKSDNLARDLSSFMDFSFAAGTTTIIPLSIATIVKEEADKLDGGMVSAIKGELVSSLQILVQFSGLLSPPPAAVHLANTAARKAAVVLSDLKSGNENMCSSSKDNSSIKAVGNMLHLIVEACIARSLIDTSAYFWPGYVVPFEESSQAQESPWSSLIEGSPLMELKDALMVTPASRCVAELEKLYSFAVSGLEEEKLVASKVLCGASLLRGWNIQEHVVQMVLKLLSTFLPLDSGSDGRYVQHMPMLHALISGISSVDAVHILSMYGLVPEVAAMLMPLCEIFGSLPPSDHRSCNFEEASVYSVFSSAFLSLLRLWKFHRPPIENALSRRGVSVWSELRLDFLLLLRNSRSALKNLSNVSKSTIFQLDPLFQKPVYIDSFPKLRAWYFQNQACIASTLSSNYNRPSVLHVANIILKLICYKVSKGGVLSVNPQSASNSSMSSPPPGVQEDMCQWPMLPAWEVLEAVPLVLEAVLTACAHGRLSSRDLVTGYTSDYFAFQLSLHIYQDIPSYLIAGLRDLADFLPASLAAIVSYFSAEITRGIWKPVMLNGTDWPSPAATLPVVESEINEVLAFAGVNINISSRPLKINSILNSKIMNLTLKSPLNPSTGSVMPMLPLPIAALISLSITVKMEEFSHLHGIIGQGIEICATSSSWPTMQIIGALWSQKVRRWHDFIILTCSQSPFTRDNAAVAQLIRSCFTSFLGPLVDGCCRYVANRGVTNLLGKTLDERARLVVAPGFLYIRSCRLFPDNNFVCEEILKVVIERARVLANDCSSERPAHLRSDCMPLSAASSLVEQISSLAATMLCHAGGVNLIRLLYEHILPTLLLSAGEDKLGSAGHICSLFEGYVLAYVLLWSGASIWGVGETSPAYASIYTSKRQRIVDRHLEFMAKVMEGNIVLGCGETTWRSYVLCFVGLLVDFVPTWILEVKLETLQKLASGLRKWHKGDLALSLLERGGNKAVTSVVESLL
ncbi:Mediator of RNA polymerase II transcription subunit 33A [Dichanthelium oligosanthes]|uniref:Mediator of RNA polymerase II transcription subunit 33A n=1 Tax=Dichanthelium oligosanthes TaxID=888268 RepID=A0A1E5ULX5_9POAL|nr:Mediator of RNA polymerase II transcription subunit 33A [Dichanthelium oligosanthes]